MAAKQTITIVKSRTRTKSSVPSSTKSHSSGSKGPSRCPSCGRYMNKS